MSDFDTKTFSGTDGVTVTRNVSDFIRDRRIKNEYWQEVGSLSWRDDPGWEIYVSYMGPIEDEKAPDPEPARYLESCCNCHIVQETCAYCNGKYEEDNEP